MAGAATTEVMAGQGPSRIEEAEPKLPVILARRGAKDTVYIATLDPYQGQPKVQKVVEIRPRTGADAGVGAVVTTATGIDYFGLSFAGDKQEFIDTKNNSILALEGDFGAASWENGTPRYLFLVNGASLVSGDMTLTAKPPTTVYAEMVGSDLLRVENRSENEARVFASVGSSKQSKTLQPGGSFEMQISAQVRPPEVAVGPWPAKEAVHIEKAPAVKPIKPGENLVTNPDMEESKQDQPVGWKLFDLFPGTSWWKKQVIYDDTVAHTGKHSLKMESLLLYQKHTYPFAWIQERVVGQGSNEAFKVSAWVKASKPTKVRLCLYGHEPGWGIAASGALSPIFTVGPEWEHISHENAFGPGITDVNLVLIRCLQIEGGEVWFDDVEVMLKQYSRR